LQHIPHGNCFLGHGAHCTEFCPPARHRLRFQRCPVICLRRRQEFDRPGLNNPVTNLIVTLPCAWSESTRKDCYCQFVKFGFRDICVNWITWLQFNSAILLKISFTVFEYRVPQVYDYSASRLFLR
jgi:hypothetical protein